MTTYLHNLTKTSTVMECIKVCPPATELSVIRNCISCPEEDCGKIFQTSSALHMHVTKHHRRGTLQRRDKSIPTHFYCPEESCVYHVNASRFFTQMKYLKQVSIDYIALLTELVSALTKCHLFAALFEGPWGAQVCLHQLR